MFTIALIGRTNVGKSTLFNRILGAERVIVSELEHTTRDRTVATTGWRGVDIRMIDTGGIEEVRSDAKRRPEESACPQRTRLRGGRATKDPGRVGIPTIEDEIRTQAQRAIGEADLLVLVTDVRDGILPGERAIAHELRRIGKPVVLACNKADNARQRAAALDFAALALGDPHPVSAKSGMGVGDLLDAIVAMAAGLQGVRALGQEGSHDSGSTALKPSISTAPPPSSPPSTVATRVAIVGEPNVGKSSLLNAILGREEVIVRPEPFTTRDIHDVEFEYEPTRIHADDNADTCGANTHRVILLDTAGIRRAAFRSAKVVRKRIEQIERMAVDRSRQALARADVAVLVLDAMRPATRHVKQLAQEIADLRRACVIVVNKVDLVERSPPPPGRGSKRGWQEGGDTKEIDANATAAAIHELFPHLSYAHVVCTSALTGDGVPNVLPAAIHATAAWRRTLDRDQLAAIYADAKRRIPKPKDREGERMLRMVELTQTDTAPPQFILHTRKRVRLPKAIPRIIEHALRAGADLEGTPVVVAVKSTE